MPLFTRLAFVGLMISVSSAEAFFFDLNGYYNSESISHPSADTKTATYYDASTGFSLDKKGQYSVGWNYGGFTSSDTINNSTTTLVTSDMGPKLEIFIDKDLEWGIGFSYNLISSATYTAQGQSAEVWRGSSLKADFGWTPKVSEVFHAGFKINYYSATYIEKLVGATTYSTVGYARSFIFPTLHVSLRY